ncbi:hypothetical protein BDW59DRAFT_144007 [Aspergillus cavernicola]|uniref:Uncharacterized protein n=1 Tax=Aspergillus cavernicola TaxID=176166 RepID=A0ABR4IJ23_9EURO
MPPTAVDTGYTSPLDECPNDGDNEDELTRMDHYYNGSIELLFDFKPKHVPGGWDSLVRLVSQLSRLQDLLWACETQFPPCLLHILDHNLRRCKLHIRAFKMPSLHQDADHPSDVDERDFALATSPCLSSVLVPLSHYDTDGCVEYNEEAVLRMAAGMTPNLTHVHIVHRPIGSSPYFHNAVIRGRPPWRGFFINDHQEGKFEASQQVHLQCWSLSPAQFDYFETWEKHIAFSDLRTLHLWEATFDTLELARRHQFESLKILALDLEYTDDQREGPTQDDELLLDEAASKFLSAIASPLESMHLSGVPHATQTFQAILDQHGKSLHTLSLITPGGNSLAGPQMSTSRIKQIKAQCPNIRDLRLPIRRTSGDANEIKIYQAFGEFPYLTDLSLELQLTDGTPESRTFSAGDDKNARDIFMSIAVDEVLAREIFTKITNAGARSLQRFKLTVNSETAPIELEPIAHVMKRQWKCIRFPGGEDGNAEARDINVVAREIGAKKRVLLDKLDEEEYHPTRLGLYERVFRELWPARTDSWKQDWHSFPLESND